MRKIYRFLVLMFVVLLIALPVFSATDMMPSKNHAGYVGKDGIMTMLEIMLIGQ